eukprot:1687956-Ditylum_brightwellii.AAC.1
MLFNIKHQNYYASVLKLSHIYVADPPVLWTSNRANNISLIKRHTQSTRQGNIKYHERSRMANGLLSNSPKCRIVLLCWFHAAAS